MAAADHKKAAVSFLKLVIAGRIDEAYQRHVDMRGKHHNAYTPAGFPALLKGMADNEAQMPNKRFEIQRALRDGNLVAVHSRLAMGPGKPVLAVVHLFRFRGAKIVELWDVAAAVPADSPNSDGAF